MLPMNKYLKNLNLSMIEEKEQSKNILILGAFGCGVFNDHPV